MTSGARDATQGRRDRSPRRREPPRERVHQRGEAPQRRSRGAMQHPSTETSERARRAPRLLSILAAGLLVLLLSACTPQEYKNFLQSAGYDTSQITQGQLEEGA